MRNLTVIVLGLALVAPGGATAAALYGPDEGDEARARTASELLEAGDTFSGVIWQFEGSEVVAPDTAWLMGAAASTACFGEPVVATDIVPESEFGAEGQAPSPSGLGQALSCLGEFVTGQELFGWFAARALHELRRGDRDAAIIAMEHAVRLDPLARSPGGEWEALEEEFLRVRARVRDEKNVRLIGTLGRLDARVDGAASLSGKWELLPGDHLLQIESGGRVVSTWFEIRDTALVGTRDATWQIVHQGLEAVKTPQASEPSPRVDAVRYVLAKNFSPEPLLLLDRGRVFQVVSETGQVQLVPGRAGRGRWRPRGSLAIGGGWWGQRIDCAPDLSGIGGRESNSDASPLVSGWCARGRKLLYPLPSDHRGTVEVSVGLHAHILSLQVAVALGVSRGTNKPFTGYSGAWVLPRLRAGLGVENPRGPVRLGLRAEATMVPASRQMVLSYDDEAGSTTAITQSRRMVIFLGGGLAGTASLRLARSPLWVRIEGAAGVAGSWYGSVQAAMEVRAP